MFANSRIDWMKTLKEGLQEDDVYFDYTSSALLSANKKIKAKIIAKQEGIWVGNHLLECANHLAKENGHRLICKAKLKDGDRIKKNQTVAQLGGDANVILAYERSILNIISYASGIATQTNELVSILKNKSIRITATRKTLPGYKKIALYSVMQGGGFLHRTTLSAGALIKENHISSYGSISNAVKEVRKKLPHLLKVEVEVKNEKELREALNESVDVVMLDNFTPTQVKSAITVIKKLNHKVRVEVSGGITKQNISSYGISGVDIISVGALTHSVKAFDFSLLC